MKLLQAFVAFLVMAVVLGAGVIAAAHGHVWVLVLGLLGFFALFIRYGCLTH